MTVRSILQGKGSNVFTMGPEATLEDVAKELSARRIGAVLIMDGDELVGVLSERDLVKHVAKDGASALSRPASSAMTRSVQTCGYDDLVDEIMERMTNSRFRHMPVVDAGRVVGLISIGDVVKLRIEEAVRERDDMRAYIHQTG